MMNGDMMGLHCNWSNQFEKRMWIILSVLFFLFKSSFSFVIVNQNKNIRHWHNTCPYYKPVRKKRIDSSLVLYSKNDEDEDDYIDIKDDDMKSFLEKNKNDVSFGIGKGRSAPSQRKAMGRSSSSSATVHVCTNCGSEFVQWLGKCPTCQQWNTIQPFQVNRSTAAENNKKKKNSKARSWLEEDENYDHDHFDDYEEDGTEYRPLEPVSLHDLLESTTNNNYENYDERIVLRDDDEWNTVLGGGIVPGSLLLLGGEPGVGKSTLLLQVASQVVKSTIHNKVLYVSGEETLHQIASRAKRLQIVHKRLQLISETNIGKITSHIKQQQQTSENSISFVIIDSIQTMYDPNTKSVPGSVTQVRDCVAALLRLAKSKNVAILCIGHVTKSGTVAGPKTVEHMVDVVLNLEQHQQDENEMKVLRAYKNRFGSTQQVGIYTTTNHDDDKKNNGRLVPCPSSMILSSSSLKEYDVEGCVMTLIQQGIRSSFMELQVLVLPLSSKGGGKRTTVAGGIVPSRVLLLMAVLMKQLGCYPLLYSHVYVNLIGYSTTGTDKNNNNNNLLDVAIMVAMVSSLTNIPIRADTCVYGQVGLLGELVGLPNNNSLLDQQMKEARQMGFSRIITPPPKKMSGRWKEPQIRDLEWITCPTILDAIQACLIEPLPTYRYKNNSHQLRIHPSIWKKQKNKDNNITNNQNEATKKDKIIIDDDDENNQDDTSFMTDYQIMMNMLKDNDKKTENEFEEEESDDDDDFYDDNDTNDLGDEGKFE